MSASQPAISVVVLAHGPEPYLGQCVRSLARSSPMPEIIVVDNGARAAVESLPPVPGMRIVQPGRNMGFAAGCSLGAAHATNGVLAFVNSDAWVEFDALKALASVLVDERIGLVTGSLRLARSPDRINSVGNPIHFLGYSWVGGLGDDAGDHDSIGIVPSISGATFAVRREVWGRLGGFDAEYFAYGEDLDLSLRAWLLGYGVVFTPAAISYHWYEPARNPKKLGLLERNRLVTMWCLYERATLVKLAPIAIVIELATLAGALRNGWGGQKVAGWIWVIRNRRWIARRRRRIQAERRRSDATMAQLYTATVDPPSELGVAIPKWANRILRTYWEMVLSSLRKRYPAVGSLRVNEIRAAAGNGAEGVD